MSLPVEILEVFYETLNGDLPVPSFEQWLYNNPQLEAMMEPDDYMDLIAFNYKADKGLSTLLEKHIRPGEFKLWKQLRIKYPQGYVYTPVKTLFDDQLQRIKAKLPVAKNKDKALHVFEAGSHEYLLNVPATEEELAAFEKENGIALPGCFRAFLQVIGNGGIGIQDAGAGPGYGIYPIGEECTRNTFLPYNCQLDPDMTLEHWKSITAFVYDKNNNLTKEQYQQATGKLYGGVLLLGTQGCSYYHAIVLNGPHRGRVVNLDHSYVIPPIFAPGAENFLDYYEQWLDNIIDGTLLGPDAPMYGYYPVVQ